MKAVVFHKPRDVRVQDVEDPIIEQASDMIIRVTTTAICGSDLHIYNGLFPQVHDLVLGHEFMGIVEDAGAEVTRFKAGDRVLVPFPIGCGQCFFCEKLLTPACEKTNPGHYGPEGGLVTEKGGGIYGYTDLYGGYPGGQAEKVRVLHADFNARLVPPELKDEEAIFLTDIFPTGWTAIDWGQLSGGETVAVFGCGPVGIMAQKAAWLQGAGRVIGVDRLDYRLKAAARVARAETINFEEEEAVDAIRRATGGRGADLCVDAVGMEADRNMLEKLSAALHVQRGSMKALTSAISAVRRGGCVSVVGVYGTPYDNFPLGQLFDKGVTLHLGQALVQKHVDRLMSLVQSRQVRLDDVITHTMPLADAPDAYAMFNDKTDSCLKVILKP